GQFRIAYSEDEVRTKIDIEPLLEIIFHVDLGEHSKIVPVECFFCGHHGVVKTHVHSLGEVVGHLRLFLSRSCPLYPRKRTWGVQKPMSPHWAISGHGQRSQYSQQLPFFRWPGGQKPFRSHLVRGR